MNTAQRKIAAAIIGPGNIGTDLMVKILRHARNLRLAAMVGVDPSSEGLKRASKLGVPVTASGIEGLLSMPHFPEIRVVFDATSAHAHRVHEAALRRASPGIQFIDLTPAAVGPFCVPAVALGAPPALNVNMVTCGGQATIPIVNAVARVARVAYAEIVASIASRSAGPGTRANIDEFTETTARAIEQVGGARKGKAIIILNPAEPPLKMRNTVYTLSEMASEEEVAASIHRMVAAVREYVPGYRLKQAVQFDRVHDLAIPGIGRVTGLKTSVFLEVEGAAHYLPAYAGNLDIMTSAALAAGEAAAERQEAFVS